MNRPPIETYLIQSKQSPVYSANVVNRLCEYALLLEKALELACEELGDAEIWKDIFLTQAKEARDAETP